MGLRKQRGEAPGVIVASSSPVDMVRMVQRAYDKPGYRKDWQKGAYRYYDTIGEVHYAANLIGSAVSRARIYIADVDEDGEIIGETSNRRMAKVSKRILGGETERPEEMRLAGINMFLAGEAYLLGRAGDEGAESDSWHMLSINDFSRRNGQLLANIDGEKVPIRPGVDLLRRMWRPHPDQRANADSAMRSVLPICYELEGLGDYVSTQINSRLMSGGMVLWPAGTRLAGSDRTAAEDLTQTVIDIAAEAIRDRGTASAAVPIFVEVPQEVLGRIQQLSFASELSKVAPELRTEAIKRMALGLDMPPEQLLGMGDANHWSAWYIDESAVKIHVEPILERACRTLNEMWVVPAAKSMGMDPRRFRLHYDTSTLTVRPQRLKDTIDLYNLGLVSAKAVLEAGAYLAGDAPSEAESARRFIRELILRSPQMIDQVGPRRLAGITDEMMPTPTPTPVETVEVGNQIPPAPERTTGKHILPVIPETKDTGTVVASAAASHVGITIAVADFAATRALELAGGRLLTREVRNKLREVPRHEIHTVVPVDRARIPDLLRNAGAGLPELADRNGIPSPSEFAALVAGYCSELLGSGKPHSQERIIVALMDGGYL